MSSYSMDVDKKGVHVLSLEGGGFRAGSILETLREMMNRLTADICAATDSEIDVRPCEIFDLIGGSGTGGIIAILIGRLGLTVDEAFQSYAELSEEIFKKGLGREALSERFEIAAKKLVAKHTGSEDTKMSVPGNKIRCKTFVLAMSPDNMDRGSVQYFRTYRSRSNQGPNCAIWEAMRATTANQKLYLDFKITESYGISMRYCGTEFGNNNPTKRLLEETKLQFKDHKLLSVISIGAGHPGVIDLPVGAESINDTLQAIVKDCEQDADEMEEKFSSEEPIRGYNPYSRFSVEQGMQGLTLGEDTSSKVITHTRNYLQSSAVSKRLNKTVEVLVGTASQTIQTQLELQELR
ncbi:acyl transferase/acyl hydrolase/lysophospholipase [Flagelloscypha sp. PMI_526]|nr:acyl transferase/acyl hydrolase/lysophospholipase [Flagelloscypha sp. PMI_526]